MTTGPFAFQRQLQSLDKMLADAPSWDMLEKQFKPADTGPLEPEAELKKWAAAFAQTPMGRQFFEYVADITFRAPYPHVGSSRDSAWLAAGKHEARAAVGLVLMRVIADGTALLSAPKEPNHEEPA